MQSRKLVRNFVKIRGKMQLETLGEKRTSGNQHDYEMNNFRERDGGRRKKKKENNEKYRVLRNRRLRVRGIAKNSTREDGWMIATTTRTLGTHASLTEFSPTSVGEHNFIFSHFHCCIYFVHTFSSSQLVYCHRGIQLEKNHHYCSSRLSVPHFRSTQII